MRMHVWEKREMTWLILAKSGHRTNQRELWERGRGRGENAELCDQGKKKRGKRRPSESFLIN